METHVVRTGRRPGNQDTREAILSAARDAFAERGYDSASIRTTIAAAAEVDPALVHHYFGTKEQLFAGGDEGAASIPPRWCRWCWPAGWTVSANASSRTLLTVWDSRRPAGGRRLRPQRGQQRVHRPDDARVHREPDPAAGGEGSRTRPGRGPIGANLVATQMAGLIMIRYIIKVEPLTSSSPDFVGGPDPARPSSATWLTRCRWYEKPRTGRCRRAGPAG